MKSTKRILAALMILVLALTLSVPVFADSDDGLPEIDRRPIITHEPAPPSKLRAGETLRVSIEAELPEGDDGQLSYAWFFRGETSPSATRPALEMELTRYHFEASVPIRVVVTNTWTDDAGRRQTASVEREMEVALGPGGFGYLGGLVLQTLFAAVLTVLCLPLMWFPWIWMFPISLAHGFECMAAETWFHLQSLFHFDF